VRYKAFHTNTVMRGNSVFGRLAFIASENDVRLVLSMDQIVQSVLSWTTTIAFSIIELSITSPPGFGFIVFREATDNTTRE